MNPMLKEPNHVLDRSGRWRTFFMLTTGVAFVIVARLFGPAQTDMSYVSVNAFTMRLLFGGWAGAGALYNVFPVFEALLMIYFLGKTNSRVVWIIVITVAVLVSIPMLPVAKLE